MTDADIDEFFRTLGSNGLLERVAGHISFDWHRHLIGFLLTHPGLARILLRRCLDWRAVPASQGTPSA